ncbi:MAG: tetratricopeptide repeat protein [Planctomycetes bacterium]|nr:tetratricopeptide repeat protein [Planctomycetota bacterium]
MFSSDSFSRYAAAWRGWSAEERAGFRQGRDAFLRGREAQKEKRYDEAREAYAAALAAAEPLGDLIGVAQAEQALGDLAVGAGRLEEAVQRHERARDIFAALRHQAMLRSCRALGFVHEKLGDLAAARINLERMLEAAREARHDSDTLAVRATLARLCRELGDEEAAEGYEREEEETEKGE